MRNPWHDLPSQPPYVLPCDEEVVAKLERSRPGTIALHLLPQPFLGNLRAPVVLLLANPGFGESDTAFENETPQFTESLRSSITHPEENPHHIHFDLRFDQGPGFVWWAKRTKELAKTCGPLSEKLLVLQRVPYHSKTYPYALENLPSFTYIEYLLKSALQRQATIVCTRIRKSWTKLVGEEPSNYFHTKNPRAVFFTPRNLSHDAFSQIVRTLQLVSSADKETSARANLQ
ncbi:MAG TPA: hypothetical protein PLN52_07135 [Opitutaceae bacterium]|nr:hypothetical protein [Opitutaceae bacterium]